MKNQIQTAIEQRDRATQVALNFAGQRISSSDGSYELLIELIQAEIICAEQEGRDVQVSITADAENEECAKIAEKAIGASRREIAASIRDRRKK